MRFWTASTALHVHHEPTRDRATKALYTVRRGPRIKLSTVRATAPPPLKIEAIEVRALQRLALQDPTRPSVSTSVHNGHLFTIVGCLARVRIAIRAQVEILTNRVCVYPALLHN